MSLKRVAARTSFGRLGLGWALLLQLPGVLPSASAAAKEGKDKLAKTACLSGDYAKGVALLAELYVSTDDIAHLYNQGRCFEQNGKYEEAIVRFREFQRKNADAGNPPDADAEKHIADCQALLDKQRPASAPAMVAPVSAPPTQPSVPAPAESIHAAGPVSGPGTATQPGPGPVDLATATSRDSGAGMRIAGIASFAVGVAGVATGVVLNLKANSLADDLDGSASTKNSSTTLYTRSAESSRSTYETFSWVGYGVGGVCLAAGAVLYYFGRSRAAGHVNVALSPVAGAGQVGAVVQGAF